MRLFGWVGAWLWLAAMPLSAQQDMRPLPRPAGAAAAEATAEEEPSALAVEATDRAPVPRPGNLLEGRELRAALAAAGRGDWDMAARLAAAEPGDGVAAEIIEWQRLRSGEGGFADYRTFLARNGDWPGLDLVRRRGEEAIPEDAAAADVRAYFAEDAPQTGQGALRLAQALAAGGDTAGALAVILDAWRRIGMGADDEAAILEVYGDVLKPYHTERLDMFLWAGDRSGAARMVERVDAGWQALAAARLGLQQQAAGVDALIEKVPEALQSDGGLAYDRMYWRIEKRRRDEAADLIIEQSTSAAALGRPDEWAYWRRVLARQAMRDGDHQRAYALASKHFITLGGGYASADLEWLSGYLALRFLDNPAAALAHFRRFTANVDTPISLSRGHYWEGRALEAMGDAAGAQAAYRRGGTHQTAFYGLLAAEKAGMPMDPALTGTTEAPDWDGALFTEMSAFKAGVALFNAGQRWEAIRFLSYLAETLPADQVVPLTDFILTLGDPFVAVRVAKDAASRGIIAPRAYFPLAPLGVDLQVEEALALSIARRESEFNAGAISPVGARGLMQLMPGTAQGMSRKLGLDYAASKLTDDPVYNATLGSAYLKELIDEFGENYVLVSVGYNAGPSRARNWVELYGDPRFPGTDPVDWVEHIPFNETQTYVMRVMESLPIYRARLTGEVQPIRVYEEMKRR